MQLSTSFLPIAETLSKLPQSKLAKIISLLLVIYIAFLLSKITWAFMDTPAQVTNQASNISASKQSSSSVNYNLTAIKALNLFGEFNAVVTQDEPEEIEDAPETNLKLTLTGVAASDIEERAAAIIEHKGVQEIYAIDETINGTRAVLKKVYNDRVHIRHSGRLETLMLDGFDYNEANKQKSANRKKATFKNRGPVVSAKDQSLVDNRQNNEIKKQAQALRNSINEDPGKITDYLKIAPKREDGAVVGYRLMPGKNPEFFKASGLKGGDVAIQMNGFDLTQALEAAQALKALKQEQEISLLVDRNGDITEILFSINE